MSRDAPANFARQRTCYNPNAGLHVAIIMDGNGRWASQRGMPRHAGHCEGARTVRTVVERASDPAAGIETLTLYAFSSDNWERPRDEVSAIMRLLGEYLRRETPRCVENGVRLSVMGRRDRLSPRLVREIEGAEAATAPGGDALHLRLAVDYSARDTLARAVALASDSAAGEPTRERLAELVGQAAGGGRAADVDLLIRTGGEQRLSDFLLWECAYAELHFTPVLWPDFRPADLDEALAAFLRRERRFGRVGASGIGVTAREVSA